MDGHQFDDLARAWAEGAATRRKALRVLTGGALAAVGVTSLADAKSRVKGDGKVKKHDDRGHNKHKNNLCNPSGKTCFLNPRKGSRGETRACKLCCGSFIQTTASKGRCCNHNSLGCGATDQCCLGVCTDGTCQNDVIQLPPPPPPPPPPVCVATGQACPPDCNPDESCVGCCQGLCNIDGNCDLNF